MTTAEAPPSPGYELFLRRLGGRGQPVFCLHGLSGSGAFWGRLAEEMNGRCRFVMPDLIGFGSSPKPEIDYNVDAHLAAIEPYFHESDEPWVLVGHSMGATLAVHLALREPERVKGLVLFSAPAFSSADRRRHLLGRQNLLTRICLRYPAADRAIAALFYGTAPLFKRVGRRLRKDLPPEVVLDYFHHTRTSYSSSAHALLVDKDLMPDLVRVTQPVLVIQGENDSMVDDPRLIDWPPGVQVEVIPSAGHLWAVTHAEEAAALIHRFFSDSLSIAAMA